MTNRERTLLQQKTDALKPEKKEIQQKKKASKISTMLQRLGNRTVQRLMIQRRGTEPFQLDDQTTGRINRERGNGAPLDSKLQMEMSDQMGFDLSGVRVHNSSESDALNRQVSAKAFTTGQDVFFKSGAYDPQSSSGRELISHELTHVVQQGTGQVKSEGGMTVNAPDDQFEQQADSVASQLNSGPTSSVAQTQPVAQRDDLGEEEEDTAMRKAVQRIPIQRIEGEEHILLKRDESLQLQDEDKDEDIQLQDQEEEEEVQMQEEEEEETLG